MSTSVIGCQTFFSVWFVFLGLSVLFFIGFERFFQRYDFFYLINNHSIKNMICFL